MASEPLPSDLIQFFWLDRDPKRIRYHKKDIDPSSDEKKDPSQVLREKGLEMAKQFITDYHSTYNAETVERILRVTKEIMDYIIFIVLRHSVHVDRFPLVLCIALYLSMIYYVKPFVSFKKHEKLSNQLFHSLSAHTNNKYSADEINQATEVILNAHRVPLQGIIQALYVHDPSPVKILGHGAYGLVCNPAFSNCHPNTGQTTNYPEEEAVTKIFYKKEKYEKALRNYDEIANIMGDPIYKAYPHTSRFVKNLPQKLSQHLNAITLTQIKPNDPVYAIRLPHMGISLHSLIQSKEHRASFQSCEFHIIMSQLYKCHGQLVRLAKRGLVHGDIRTPNIMWNKKTGGLYLIDFDFLSSYEEFTQKYWGDFGSVREPPECLLILNEKDGREKTSTWLSENYKSFNEMYYKNHFMGKPEVSSEKFDEMVVAAQEKNKPLIAPILQASSDEDKYMAFRSLVMPFYDSYTYASCMSDLFSAVYPSSMNEVITDEEIEAKATHLKTTLKDVLLQGDVPYSSLYLRHIANTITMMTELFRKMLSFEVESRLTIVDSFEAMKKIYRDFVSTHNDLMPEKAIVIEDISWNAVQPSMKQGGKRTRRRDKKRHRRLTKRR